MAVAPAPANTGNPALNQILGSLAAPTAPTGLNANAFLQSMNAANAANSQRGQGILQLLQGQGQSQIAQNNLNYNNQLGQIQNDMVGKGLAGTSIGDSLNLGANKNLQMENNAVNQNAALQEANVANSFSQNGPSMSLLAQLLQNGAGGKVAPAAPPMMAPGGGAFGGQGNLLSQGFGGNGAFGAAVQQQSQSPPIVYGNPNNTGDTTGNAWSPYSTPAPYTPMFDPTQIGGAVGETGMSDDD